MAQRNAELHQEVANLKRSLETLNKRLEFQVKESQIDRAALEQVKRKVAERKRQRSDSLNLSQASYKKQKLEEEKPMGMQSPKRSLL